MILGITGNIASGKSTIARALAERGATVVDADQLAREVIASDSSILRQMAERFGNKILDEKGQLNRQRLGQIIFNDPAARQDLNAIMHPAIARLALQRLKQVAARPGVSLVVYEAPLLFEAGAEDRVDKVLVVKIDPQIQLQRLMQRDEIDETAARERVVAQMPQQEKLARADFVIDNSGTVEQAQQQVARLWDELLEP